MASRRNEATQIGKKRLPTLPRVESLNIYSGNDDSDNDIYVNESEDEDLDELQTYLSETRQNKQAKVGGLSIIEEEKEASKELNIDIEEAEFAH
ncbi:hypothetical protein OnM2_061074 [Erysiphe neolycopersici]|uniref:Uncharacterized protein n=1 Tax=Erysiphe neolycopersici TaxID=212602 RepID=A0A420HPA3_9PEZI|nr:hypothetical protein OnM2_061074 [Erysiphe neolycopersici]